MMMDPVFEPEPMDMPMVEDDVLELTQVAPDEPVLPDPFDYDPPPPPPPPPPRRPMPPMDEDGLLSAASAEAASRAFSSLSGFKRGPSLIGEGPIGNGGTTLEEIVHALVRPMIKEWLDDNLPPMVERLVKREIEKVVRRGLD